MLFAEKLKDIVGDEAFLADEPMSAHTTFRIGGPADYFVSPSSIEQIQCIWVLCRQYDIPLRVLGCGSNVLVADEGVSGVVMRLGSRFSQIDVQPCGVIQAQAGAKNSAIAKAALSAGLGGFEFAAGIPGSIGGAAIMNAGAYGGELKDVATSVICLNDAGDVVELSAEQAAWGYRESAMSRDGSIVLSVQLQLHLSDPASISATMDDLMRRRNDKQPLDKASAGSTFKRPDGYYAGKLIQDACMQGKSVGDAQVSPKHAGFIVNNGSATAHEVRSLIDEVKQAVLQQFSVELEPEVKFWGF